MSGDGAAAGLRADICIVGAGIAGIALARRLRGSGLRILILESGDLRHHRAAQELNAGLSEDPSYPFVAARSRGFGGTSRLWYGACIPLNPEDFERRDWLPHSGWPIDFATLAPHYEATRALFGIPPLEAAARDLAATPLHGGDLAAQPVAHADPPDLGRRFWAELSGDPDIDIRLDATVTSLHVPAGSDRVSRLEVRALNGDRTTASAGVVILACGGIENARLLLMSNHEHPAGIGNRHDVVGRYHMEHPFPSVGVLDVGTASRGLRAFVSRGLAGGADVIGTLGLSPETRARHGLLDMHLRGHRYHAMEASPAVVRAKDALGRLGGPESPRAAARLATAVATPGVPRYVGWHFAGKLTTRAPFRYIRFSAFLEQEPDPSNRIRLGDATDRFGRPLPRLQWRQSDFMRESHARSLSLLEQAFAANGLGRFLHRSGEIDHLRVYDKYGLHHMGSTRMHQDPRSGVVDDACKVHGVSNLYVVGSSVFPTGGAANPTWTIAALAHRLGGHLLARRCGAERRREATT